jgi:hypothetical protein
MIVDEHVTAQPTSMYSRDMDSEQNEPVEVPLTFAD